MISATIVKHSISENGVELPTIHMVLPRIVLPELLTHRVFARNARSSRAVPVATYIKEVRDNPFIPIHFGKNQSGMQAFEEIDAVSREEARRLWIEASVAAADYAEKCEALKLHKQFTNRILDPYVYVHVLVSATEWANFFTLRDHEDAEPHIREAARQVKVALDNSTPQLLRFGEWHLPYITDEDYNSCENYALTNGGDPLQYIKQVSTARCARISYKPFGGEASVNAEIKRFDKLITSKPIHASPTEHLATPDRYIDPRAMKPEYWHPNLSGNFHGWIQFRKLLEA